MKFSRRTIREYAESLAIAFILAMIIRHFAVEAFRIPTSSMEPTLIGRQSGGDRILVSKFEFDLHPPQPWEIVVFKVDEVRIDYHKALGWSNRKGSAESEQQEEYYRGLLRSVSPNDNGTIKTARSPNYINYVKRLVGLPGQTVLVKNGSVFINGRISRKPDWVLDGMLIPVTNDKLRRDTKFLDLWTAEPSDAVDAQGGVVTLRGSRARRDCELTYREQVRDRVETDLKNTPRRESYGSLNSVADLELAFRFRHDGGSGYLTGRLGKNGRTYSFSLPLGKPGEPIRVLSRDETLEVTGDPLDGAKEHEVRFSNVDARIRLLVDGKTVISWDDDSPDVAEADKVREVRRHRSDVRFGVTGADVTVRDVRLARDLFYTSDTDTQKYGVGKAFTLGPGECFMLGDNSANSFDSRSWGTVSKENLVGGAFFVFWPVPRWKLVY